MKEKLSISINRDVIEAIKNEAKNENRTISNYLETIILRYWKLEEDEYIMEKWGNK